ncbi:hypothetical protein FRC17_001348 [Serendipita sp. 399]|nr:hypothetical protein FRC17_001348 [Serendipita sp. 399]
MSSNSPPHAQSSLQRNSTETYSEVQPYDPIEILPTELSLKIIWEVVTKDANNLSIDGLLALTLVSPQWRNFLLSSPYLWSHITVGHGFTEADSASKLETCLVLSREAPLTLYLHGRIFNWEYHQQFIQRHTWRISRVVMKLAHSSAPSRYQVESQRAVLISLGHMPSLHSIQFDPITGHQWLTRLMENAPSLNAINSVCNVEQLPLYKHLFTFARTNVRPDSLHASLSILHASKVQQLTMSIEHHPIRDSPVINSDKMSRNDSLTLPRIHALQLREMGDSRPTPHSIMPKLIMYFPNISSLTVNLSSGGLNALLPVLPSLPRLQMLYLGIELDLEQPLHVEGHVSPSKVTFLNLHVRNYHSGLDREEQELFESYLQDLATLLQIAIPFVSTLSLGSEGQPTPELLHSLQEWRSIRELRLYLNYFPCAYEVSSVTLEEIEINALRLMESKASTRPDIQIECPNLLRLRLKHSSDDIGYSQGETNGWALSLNSYAFSPLSHSISVAFYPEEASHSLRSLDTLHSPWVFGSFQHLKRLAFSRYMLDWAAFFIHFIRYPYLCPNLDYIEFRTYPEWDLLFLMLERRNLLPPSYITSIKTLLFPSSLPFVLLHPLTQLLGGQAAHRLSNHDLSVTNLMLTCLDSSM